MLARSRGRCHPARTVLPGRNETRPGATGAIHPPGDDPPGQARPPRSGQVRAVPGTTAKRVPQKTRFAMAPGVSRAQQARQFHDPIVAYRAGLPRLSPNAMIIPAMCRWCRILHSSVHLERSPPGRAVQRQPQGVRVALFLRTGRAAGGWSLFVRTGIKEQWTP